MKCFKNIQNKIAFISNAALFSGSRNCYNQNDIYKLRFPFQSIYIINNIEIANQILVRNESSFEKSKIYWKQLRQIIGKAMGSLEGEEWLVLRKLQNSFFTKSHIDSFLEQISVEIDCYTDTFSNSKPFLTQFSVLNLELVKKHVFGVIESNLNNEKMYQIITNGEDFIAWKSKFPWRKYTCYFNKFHYKAQKDLKELSIWTDAIINEKKFTDKGLLNTLLNNNYSKKHIRNELIVHLGAATETVAVVEIWTMYLLCKNQNFLTQAIEEVQKSVNSDGKIDANSISKLVFLEQCIKESMRLYPPSHALVRDAINPVTINGIKIKKGDSFYISVFGIHRNEKYYKNPEIFNPNRFSIENEDQIIAQSYLPFGLGKHTCIGKYLAMPMILFTLSNYLLKHNLKLENTSLISVLSGSTLKPSQEISIKMIKK